MGSGNSNLTIPRYYVAKPWDNFLISPDYKVSGLPGNPSQTGNIKALAWESYQILVGRDLNGTYQFWNTKTSQWEEAPNQLRAKIIFNNSSLHHIFEVWTS